MEIIIGVLSIFTLYPPFGIGSLCYAIYLLVRKKPSGFKMLLLKEEDVLPYTKTEASIFFYGVLLLTLCLYLRIL